MTQPGWMERARCGQEAADRVAAGEPVEDVYAELDRIFFDCGNPNQARRICNGCPVQTECLLWASEKQVPHGVFAGEQGAARRQRLGLDQFGTPIGHVA